MLQLMAEFHKLLNIKLQFTLLFHPSRNGCVERLHESLKIVFWKLCNEMRSDCTNSSASDLLYGQSAKRPLIILKDLWEHC